ncbi:MAG: hypothetical protein QGH15_23260, partial [Kiritimatiellia bacterium]|nr:hypothetical protein [Kiritimatiellia bacterium]
LAGDLTAGSLADVTMYWGPTDGGDTSSAWANTNTLTDVSQGTFSSDSSGGLTFGKTYFFRCYATNALGDDWADSTATFLTAPTEIPAYSNGLHLYGYHINNDSLAMDLDNNG